MRNKRDKASTESAEAKTQSARVGSQLETVAYTLKKAGNDKKASPLQKAVVRQGMDFVEILRRKLKPNL